MIVGCRRVQNSDVSRHQFHARQSLSIGMTLEIRPENDILVPKPYIGQHRQLSLIK